MLIRGYWAVAEAVLTFYSFAFSFLYLTKVGCSTWGIKSWSDGCGFFFFFYAFQAIIYTSHVHLSLHH